MEPGGATIRDGPHELYIYKCEDRSRLSDPAVYLTLPSGSREAAEGLFQTAGSPPFSRSSKEAVFVHTLLCSTKLTQNGKLEFLTPLPLKSKFWFSTLATYSNIILSPC